ncbi:MAG: hypothetical protein KA198_05555 [Chitinophagaceae bacterium]|nr:hypothetical protein [Chitinophagaceae bacterium]
MIKQCIGLLVVSLILSCNANTESKETLINNSIKTPEQHKHKAADVALKFINAYTDNCNKMKESQGVVEWVNASQLTTTHFRTELKTLISQANGNDTTSGLEADPIFDAQDYPEKGFELESFDQETNLVEVKGKEWADFRLKIKLVYNNEKWLVDGCGSINIPKEERIVR